MEAKLYAKFNRLNVTWYVVNMEKQGVLVNAKIKEGTAESKQIWEEYNNLILQVKLKKIA